MKLQIAFLVSLAVVLAAASDEVPATKTERVCEPGKEFTKECSVCKCNGEGTEFTCEKKDCPEGQKIPEATPETVVEEKCTPGELFKIKCNECKCPESGLRSQAACTVIGCPEE